MGGYMHMCVIAHRGLKKLPDPQELDWQLGLSQHGCWEWSGDPLKRVFLTAEPSSQPPRNLFFNTVFLSYLNLHLKQTAACAV